MSQPLGDAVGNALDVAEAVAVLRGRAARTPARPRGAPRRRRRRAALEGVDADEAVARARARARRRERRSSGSGRWSRRRAATRASWTTPTASCPRAPVIVPIEADATGTLAAVDAEAIGRAAAALGAGRVRKGDPIDPAVGIVCTPKIGDRLEVGAADRRRARADRRGRAATPRPRCWRRSR